MADSALQDVFRFVSIRAPQTPVDDQWYRHYTKDKFITYRKRLSYQDRDLKNKEISRVGGKIFEDVVSLSKTQEVIVQETLEIPNFGRKVKIGSDFDEREREIIFPETKGIFDDNGQYVFSKKEGGTTYSWLLRHTSDFSEKLDIAAKIIESHLVNYNKKILICQLEQALGESSLSEFVFQIQREGECLTTGTGNTDKFKQIKGNLFDLLYFLYVSKREFPVSLEHITHQIQTFHVIEYLGYDDFFENYQAANQRPGCNWLATWFNRLFNISRPSSNKYQSPAALMKNQSNFPIASISQNSVADITAFSQIGPFVLQPYISNQEDLNVFFNVEPIIHVIFCRLTNLFIPFNDIRPIGVADLKLVKQILVRYEPGEVAHIENVLKGESKERIHRQLDTIETFVSDEATQESELNRETQTADRNEMQRETEKTINEVINVNAGATVSYKNPIISATVNAGFSWNKSTEESTKTANKFAKEIMNKSAERITQRVQGLRTTRRKSETEETNRHGIDNSSPGSKHVTGIYRYVNKRYKAAVFNYGKRMMFEFLIPEPAEFYKKTIENKNKYGAGKPFECNRPSIPTLSSKNINDKNGITQEVAKEYAGLLGTTFDSYPYPTDVKKTEKRVLYAGNIKDENMYNQPEIIRANIGNSVFTAAVEGSMRGQGDLDWGTNKGEIISPNPVALTINTKVIIKAQFISNAHWGHHWDDTNHIWNEPAEKAWIYLDCDELNKHIEVAVTEETKVMVTSLNSIDQNGYPSNPGNSINDIVISSNQAVSLTFKSHCDWCQFYLIAITVIQEEDLALIDAWKKKIFDEITTKVTAKNIEIAALCKEDEDKANAAKKLAEDAAMVQIKGQNPLVNKAIINEELHKHTITLFAKEFDQPKDGDLLGGNPITQVAISVPKFKGAAPKDPTKPINDRNLCEVTLESECKVFPVIDIEMAQKKGEVVQFLEQAFEWDKISYWLYPYFYGDQGHWMDTYDHYKNEPNDNDFVAFLRAGYARVLVPVRPGYDSAVLYFLNTRMPWNGGSAPVLDDKDLYLPIYEEVRNQTDEYEGACQDGDSWEFVLPTSLIYLQESYQLPTYDSAFPLKTQCCPPKNTRCCPQKSQP